MDNNYKVKLDVRKGIVEVEGDKEFIQTILEKYGEVIRKVKSRKKASKKENKTKVKKTKTTQVQEVTETLEYLNTVSNKFLGYLEKYGHENMNDRYLIYIKFLKDNSLPTTVDNIYTCDTQSGSREISTNPLQKLRDLERRGTHVYVDKENNWHITTQGNARLQKIEK